MATDVTLYIGPATAYSRYRITDAEVWARVHAQIIAAMDAGKGTIEVPRRGSTLTYVYSPHLYVCWSIPGE